jgi:hypothetical protein
MDAQEPISEVAWHASILGRRAQRLRAKGDDGDITAGHLIGIQRADRRYSVKDTIVLQEDGIKGIGEREITQVTTVQTENRRDPTFDVLPVDQHDKHPIDAVAMRALGRRLAGLAGAGFNPELMQLHVPSLWPVRRIPPLSGL